MAAHNWADPWTEPAPGKPALAHAWAQAVLAYAPEGTARAEVELRLRRHLETLHDALLAEPPDAAAAERVGAGLVALGLDRPPVVGATVAVLGDRLLAELGLDEVTFAGPLHALLGAVATGWAWAVTPAT